MGMLKLVIAEDEDIIRMGLVQTIDWQAMEVELVGEAAGFGAGEEISAGCTADRYSYASS